MKVFLKHISCYLPEAVLSNSELSQRFPEWSVEKVTNKTGIEKRHISQKNETAGDMAIKAAEKLFSESKIKATEIDFIIFCTQSPDYFLPTTACIIQNKLGVPTNAGAIDINQGCSGYIYGLSLAKGLISAGIAENILFLTSETYSKYIHVSDKGNLSLFGDGATATLIRKDGFAEIGDFVLGSDGSGAEDLMVKNGGARNPRGLNYLENHEITKDDHLYMDGSKVFNFTLKAVPKLIDEIIMKCKLSKSEVDYFVFHQANKFMLQTLRKVCKIEEEKFIINMSETGNTVSSTIPIALLNLMEQENLYGSNKKIIIAGFGVGYSWGSCLLNFN